MEYGKTILHIPSTNATISTLLIKLYFFMVGRIFCPKGGCEVRQFQKYLD